jgi:hypothetical protein
MLKRKSRKPKPKKEKRLVIRVDIVPMAEVLPLLDKSPNHKRKPKLDVNPMAAGQLQTTIRESEK